MLTISLHCLSEINITKAKTNTSKYTSSTLSDLELEERKKKKKGKKYTDISELRSFPRSKWRDF